MGSCSSKAPIDPELQRAIDSTAAMSPPRRRSSGGAGRTAQSPGGGEVREHVSRSAPRRNNGSIAAFAHDSHAPLSLPVPAAALGRRPGRKPTRDQPRHVQRACAVRAGRREAEARADGTRSLAGAVSDETRRRRRPARDRGRWVAAFDPHRARRRSRRRRRRRRRAEDAGGRPAHVEAREGTSSREGDGRRGRRSGRTRDGAAVRAGDARAHGERAASAQGVVAVDAAAAEGGGARGGECVAAETVGRSKRHGVRHPHGVVPAPELDAHSP